MRKLLKRGRCLDVSSAWLSSMFRRRSDIPSSMQMDLTYEVYRTSTCTQRQAHRLTQMEALLLKNEHNWPLECTLAVMHNTTKKTVNCLCIGLDDSETENAIKSIDTQLRHTPNAVANELSIPAVLMDLCVTLMSEDTLYKYQKLLWDVQSSTGLHGGRAWDISQMPNDANLDKAIIQLTALSDSCARATSRVQTLKRMLIPIEEVLSEQIKSDPRNAEEIRHIVSLVDQSIAGSKQFLEWYQASIQSQVQTVSGVEEILERLRLLSSHRYTPLRTRRTAGRTSIWPRALPKLRYEQLKTACTCGLSVS